MQTPLRTMRLRVPAYDRGYAGKPGIAESTLIHYPDGGAFSPFARKRKKTTSPPTLVDKPHQGWDLYADPGTEVLAISGGTIVGCGPIRGYGQTLLLEFAYKGRTGVRPATLYALYAHLGAAQVTSGEVAEGQVLGVTGTSDAAGSPPHLHFEIWISKTPGQGLEGRINPGDILGYQYINLDDQVRVDVG